MAGRPRKPDRVYLDSSVWLSWFEGGSAQPGQPVPDPDPALEIEEYFVAGPVTTVEFDVRVA